MTLDNINPFIRYAKSHEYFIERKENSICYDCRLFYIKSGKGNIRTGDKTVKVSENTLIYLPPRTTYRFEFQDYGSVRIEVINFDLTDSFSHKKSSLGTAREGEFDITRSPVYSIVDELSHPVFISGAQFVKTKIEEISEAYLIKSEYYREICSAKLKLVLFDAISNEGRADKEPDPAYAIENYIKENYHRHELNNVKIAMVFNYHPYHASRILKARTGKTLREYLIDFRLHIARNYLATSRLSVTEISEKCGFASYNNFIKCFREKVGISPLKYRKEGRELGL